MPTYDYKCRVCDHRWEEFQSITAEPTKKCPSCGKKKAERVIGAGAGILFKGSGFYQTDYRSEGYKKAADAEKKSAESKTDKKEKKSDGGAKAGSAKSAKSD
ncbi:MAG: zinc ribbon domain-containing protein [Planctomycetota bacterium]